MLVAGHDQAGRSLKMVVAIQNCPRFRFLSVHGRSPTFRRNHPVSIYLTNTWGCSQPTHPPSPTQGDVLIFRW